MTLNVSILQKLCHLIFSWFFQKAGYECSQASDMVDQLGSLGTNSPTPTQKRLTFSQEPDRLCKSPGPSCTTHVPQIKRSNQGQCGDTYGRVLIWNYGHQNLNFMLLFWHEILRLLFPFPQPFKNSKPY